MKTIKIISMLIVALALTTSCSSDDDEVVNDTPQEIETFVNLYFPNNTILQITKESSGSSFTYDVKLSGNIDLEFNSNREVIDIDSNTKLPNSLIPEKIMTYVETNYPDNFIIGWELEMDHQQVELNNGLELEFTMNGEFIRVDN